MKYNVQNLAFLSAVITFASCQQHKNAAIDESGNEVVKVRQPTEDTIGQATTTVETQASTTEPTPAPATQRAKNATKPSAKTEKPASEIISKPGRSLTVKGVVTDINNGKDGYTAKLKTTDDQVVAVTISRSNLTNPKQYKTVAIGDVLKVTGESWILDGVSQITVRDIQ